MAIDYFEGQEDFVPAAATLENLRSLADDATILETEIAEQQLALQKKVEEHKKLTQRTIPDIMKELQMKSFKLLDGSELKIEDQVQCSIPAHKKAEAFEWLKKYGFDGIIKTSVSITFGKGEIENARKVQSDLAEKGIIASLDQSVHASTLKSFVKERLAAAGEYGEHGEHDEAELPAEASDGFDDSDTPAAVRIPNLPQDVFGVYEFQQAKIVLPKKKK